MSIDLINDYIFKKRYIYSLNDTNTVEMTLNNISCNVLSGETLLRNKHIFIDSNIQKKIKKRSENPNIICLVCQDEKEKVVGYFWAIIPNEQIWHDSIPIKKGQGFLYNGYVNPSYRGENVFPYLINKLSTHLKKEYKIQEIIDVVENKNKASIRAHSKVNATVYCENYLLKFIGRNIISIYKKKIYILKKNRRNRI